MSIILTKKDLKLLCDSSDREEQMLILTNWGIPFQIHPLNGSVKVLTEDLKWSAENSTNEGPRYGAA